MGMAEASRRGILIGKRRPVDAAFLIGRLSRQGANLGQLSAIAHGEYRPLPFVLAFVARPAIARPQLRVRSVQRRSLSPSSPFPTQLRPMKRSV